MEGVIYKNKVGSAHLTSEDFTIMKKSDIRDEKSNSCPLVLFLFRMMNACRGPTCSNYTGPYLIRSTNRDRLTEGTDGSKRQLKS
jgi:hypothetical protein